MSRLRRDQRGSAVVELAIVLPVFLAVVLGSLSILWMLTARSALSGAARDGARYASIRDADGYPTEAEVAAFVRDRAGRFDVARVQLLPPTQPNEAFSVTVAGELPVLLRSVASLFGDDDLEFTTTVKARSE